MAKKVRRVIDVRKNRRMREGLEQKQKQKRSTGTARSHETTSPPVCVGIPPDQQGEEHHGACCMDVGTYANCDCITMWGTSCAMKDICEEHGIPVPNWCLDPGAKGCGFGEQQACLGNRRGTFHDNQSCAIPARESVGDPGSFHCPTEGQCNCGCCYDKDMGWPICPGDCGEPMSERCGRDNPCFRPDQGEPRGYYQCCDGIGGFPAGSLGCEVRCHASGGQWHPNEECPSEEEGYCCFGGHPNHWQCESLDVDDPCLCMTYGCGNGCCVGPITEWK